MKNVVKKERQGNKILFICEEHGDRPNPRTEYENDNTMVCFHNRYNLGDENHGYKSRDYDNWGELKEALIENEDVFVILPLYLYDHSGITMNTTGFSCRWDSGQVGFIFMNKTDAEAHFGKHYELFKEDAEESLRNSVAYYDKYITGEATYSYHVFDVVDNSEDADDYDSLDTLDSCYCYDTIEDAFEEGKYYLSEEVAA